MTALAVAACTGGDLDGASDQITDTPDDAESDLGVGPDDQQTGGSAGSVGPVTATADPGQAWIEVDGERIVYEASGSQHYTCDVQRDGFTIHYIDGWALLEQTSENSTKLTIGGDIPNLDPSMEDVIRQLMQRSAAKIKSLIESET